MKFASQCSAARQLCELRAWSEGAWPLAFRPNAGLPVREGGRLVYKKAISARRSPVTRVESDASRREPRPPVNSKRRQVPSC